MPLTPEQIKAEREKYGITVPNKRVAEFDALLNISKSEPTLGTPDRQSGIDTPNLGENTATEMEAGGQKIVDSVSRAADKFNQAGDIFGENGGRALAGKVGALTEGALGTASGAVQTIFAPLSATIKTISDKISDSKAVQDVAQSKSVSALLDKVNSSMGPLQKFAETHPDATRNIVDGINVALAAMGDRIPALDTPVSKVGSALKNDIADVAESAVARTTNIKNSAMERISAVAPDKKGAKAFSEAIEVSRPSLTPLEKEAALKEGRVQSKGILRKKTVTPNAADQRAAESIQSLVEEGRVSAKSSPEKNISEISTEVSRINHDLGNFIADNKVPFNEKQLRTKLNAAKDESKLIFASEPTAERTFNAVVDEFVSHVKGKDTKGLFDARQDFDKVPAIRKLLENEKLGENVRRQIVLDVRKAANNYVSDLLPENSPYKAMLSRETNMLRAIENIANANRGQIDTNAIQRLLKKHPWIKYAISGIAGGTATGVGLKVLGD
jgi:hypothetical protein